MNPSFNNLAQRLANEVDQWRVSFWDLICDLRVAIPCQVVSFDAAAQTITAQPLIRENININSVPTPVELPQLIYVPVMFPRAGGFALTFPISTGDECLVVFADMCIDAWWQNSGVQNQEDHRRHDLSDGFAIFAPTSQPNKLTGYATSTVQLRSDDGSTIIELANGAVNITAATITVNGNLVVTGNIDGKNFLTHRHSGVATGGSNSGPVV